MKDYKEVGGRQTVENAKESNTFFQPSSVDSADIDHIDILKDDVKVPEGFDRVVPVVFSVNDYYAPYAGVAIESILENVGERNYYRIYILHAGITAPHIQMLEAIQTPQLSVRCLDIGLLIQNKSVELPEIGHLTKEAFYRLLIPEIFDFYSEVIYLDCDLIVRRDIADIIPDDLGDCLIAAVRNYAINSTMKRLYDDFQLDGTKYINSGILVINTAQWKKEHTVDRCFEEIKRIPAEKLRTLDQEIINIVCQNKIYYLDEAWNFYWHMLFMSSEFISVCKPVADRVGEDFYILHFASNVKPWTSPELPLSRYFWHYAIKSPFCEEILNRYFLRAADILQQKEERLRQKDVDLRQKDVDLRRKNEELRQKRDLLKQKDKELKQKNYQIKQKNQKYKKMKHKLDSVTKSASFRIGRGITWVPRKVRSVLLKR